MSILSQSLLDTRCLSSDQILNLFHLADKFQNRSRMQGFFYDPDQAPAERSKVVALLFLEPSTRTRMSFQMATYRLGLSAIVLDSIGSSLSKGESMADTVLNLAALKPDVIVIRHGPDPELEALLPELSIPVISAGNSAIAHPTQALLDAYTIWKERGRLSGERVLIIGDILHSRVARSNFDVLAKLGAEIGICGPAEFLPSQSEYPHIKYFNNVDEGFQWATVCMALRIQLERHEANGPQLETKAEYHQKFGVTVERLQRWTADGILLHPGPINHGVEMASEALKDPRCRVLEQVTNGALIRAALLAQILGI